MILKLIRHLSSHKKVFNVDVDVADKSSLEKALAHLNLELLGDVSTTRAFCVQESGRNKLLKLRLGQNNKLLSKQLACGGLHTSWAEQTKRDLSALGINLSSKDHGASEFIFARAVLEFPELTPQLVDFVDRITIFTSLPDSKLMSYSDLVNLGFMAAVAITLYAPQEIQSAIALFNAMGKYRDGSYTDRYSSGVLIALYRQYEQYPQVSEILAHHLASFVCYPDSGWSAKAKQITIYDVMDVEKLTREFRVAIEQWCFDFHIEDPESYIERFIQPVFKDPTDVECISDVYRPFKQAALNAQS